MSSDQDGRQDFDVSEMTRTWAELAEQSGRVVQAFLERQDGGHAFSIVDPGSVLAAFGAAASRMAADPTQLVEAQMRLWQDNMKLWDYALKRAAGEEPEPLVEPDRGDRRFKDETWTKALIFDYIKQSYLLTTRWMHDVVGGVEGLDRKDQEKVDFYTRQMTSALAPSNFALSNPAVLKKTSDSHGDNLVNGLRHLLEDLEKGRGRLQISMTDASAFEVGKNVASTPGKVVFQNELMQLIQYAPATETVHKRPLLIVPPWINKFYVLDLQPKNSFIKWCVDQGLTVFVISWVNPRKDLAHKSFADYMKEGPLAALDAIEQATGERESMILGFCIGGILTVATLAVMAAKGDTRVKAATFFATMVDFQEVGEVSVFIDDAQVANVEQYVAEKGYLEAHHLADMFNMMRENDLIWSFVVNNYLLGREPMPFDLLYWNSDSTRLPAAMLTFYLREVYRENKLMQPGGIVLDGTPVDLGRVEAPCYFLATKEDHIAPWISTFPAIRAIKGPVRFVLGASGHIAGVINPPAANKYCYWTNGEAQGKNEMTPERWLEGATQHEGSWWTDWIAWLKGHAGPEVPAREPGAGKLKALEDAPGSYVKVRAGE